MTKKLSFFFIIFLSLILITSTKKYFLFSSQILCGILILIYLVNLGLKKKFFEIAFYFVIISIFFFRFFCTEQYKLVEEKNYKFLGYIYDWVIENGEFYQIPYRVEYISDGINFRKIQSFNILLKISKESFNKNRFSTFNSFFKENRNKKNNIENFTNFDLKKFNTIEVDCKVNKFLFKKEGFDYKAYLNSKNIKYFAKVNNLKKVDIDISLTQKAKIFIFIREKIIEKIKQNLTNESFVFILSILFGDRSFLDKNTNESYKKTGMIHLLAISGTHINLIAGIITTFLFLLLPNNIARFFSIFFLFVYIILLNYSPSSIRAFLMFSFQVIYLSFNKNCNSLTPLSISGIIMVFILPEIIYDYSFILSFLATFGIIVYSKILNKITENLTENSFVKENIFSNINITLSAIITAGLIQIASFKTFPFFSIFSSVLIVPLFNILFIFILINLPLMLINFHISFYLINIFVGFFNKIIILFATIAPMKIESISINGALTIILTLFFIYIFCDNRKNRKLKLMIIDFMEFLKYYYCIIISKIGEKR